MESGTVWSEMTGTVWSEMGGTVWSVIASCRGKRLAIIIYLLIEYNLIEILPNSQDKSRVV